MPIWINFDELTPPPKNKFYYEGVWKSNVLGNPKKGVTIEIFDIDVRGRSDFFITGDVPVHLHQLPEAREKLKEIDGCAILTEHKHNDERDIHPLCHYTTRKEAKQNIPKIWKWANNWMEDG